MLLKLIKRVNPFLDVRSYYTKPTFTPLVPEATKPIPVLPKTGEREFENDLNNLPKALHQYAQNSVAPFWQRLAAISNDRTKDLLPTYAFAIRMIKPEKSDLFDKPKLEGSATLITPCNFDKIGAINLFDSSRIGTLNLVNLANLRHIKNGVISEIAAQDIGSSNRQPAMNYETYFAIFNDLIASNSTNGNIIAHNEIILQSDVKPVGIVITNNSLLNQPDDLRLIKYVRDNFSDTNLFHYSPVGGVLSIGSIEDGKLKFSDISPALPDSILSQNTLQKHINRFREKKEAAVREEAKTVLEPEDVESLMIYSKNIDRFHNQSEVRFPSVVLETFKKEAVALAKKKENSAELEK